MAKRGNSRKYLIEFIVKGDDKAKKSLTEQLKLVRALKEESAGLSSAIDFAEAEQKTRVFNNMLKGQVREVKDLAEAYNGLKKSQAGASPSKSVSQPYEKAQKTLEKYKKELQELAREEVRNLDKIKEKSKQIKRLEYDMVAKEAAHYKSELQDLIKLHGAESDEVKKKRQEYEKASQALDKQRAAEREAIQPTNTPTNRGTGTRGDDMASLLQSGSGISLRGDAAGNVSSVAEMLGGLSPQVAAIGAAIAAVVALTNEVAQLEGEFQDLLRSIQRYSNLTQAELEDVVLQANALSKVFGETSGDILKAARAVSKNLNEDFRETFDLIEQGFLNGANASGRFLDTLSEYSVQFRLARISAEDFVRIATVEAQEGVFNDKLSDAVKEFGLRIRELSAAQQSALAPLGRRFIADLVQDINTGTLSATQGLQRIYEQSVAVGLSQRELQTITADLGAEALEDIGGLGVAYDLLTKAQNVNLDSLDALGRRRQRFLERQEMLTEATDDLAKTTGGASESWDLLLKTLGTIGVRALNNLLKPFIALGKAVKVVSRGIDDLLLGVKGNLIPQDFAPATQSIGELNEAIAENERRLKTAKEAAQAYYENTAGLEAMSEAQKAVVKTNAEMRAGVEKINQALDEQRKMLKEVEDQSNQFSRRMQALGGVLEKIDNDLGTVLNRMVFTDKARETRPFIDDVRVLSQSLKEQAGEDGVIEDLNKFNETYRNLMNTLQDANSEGADQLLQRLRKVFVSGEKSGIGNRATLFTKELELLNKSLAEAGILMQDLASGIVPTNEELQRADQFFMDLRHQVGEYQATLKTLRTENDQLTTELLQGQEKRVASLIGEMSSIDAELNARQTELQNLIERRKKELSTSFASKDLNISEDIIVNTSLEGLEAITPGGLDKLDKRRKQIIGQLSAQIKEAEREAEIARSNAMLSFVRSQVETYSDIGERVTESNINAFKRRYQQLIEDGVDRMGGEMSDAMKERLELERNMYFASLEAAAEVSKAEKALDKIRKEAQTAEIERRKRLLDLQLKQMRLDEEQALAESASRTEESVLNREEADKRLLPKLFGFSFIDSTLKQDREMKRIEEERLDRQIRFTESMVALQREEAHVAESTAARKMSALRDENRAMERSAEMQLRNTEELAAGAAMRLGSGVLREGDKETGGALGRRRESVLSGISALQSKSGPLTKEEEAQLRNLELELAGVNRELVELYNNAANISGADDEAVRALTSVKEAAEDLAKVKKDSANKEKELALENTKVIKDAEAEQVEAAVAAENAKDEKRDWAAMNEKERQKQLREAILTTISLAVQSYRQVTDVARVETERQMEIQEERIAKLKERDEDGRNAVDKGNAEQLQKEEERLDRLIQERQKFVERQQALDLIEFASASAVAIARAAKEGGGILSPLAIATVLGAIAGGVAQIAAISNQIPLSETDYYEKGGKVKGEQRQIMVNEKGEEYVINAESTRKSEKLLEAINAGQIDDRVFSSMLTLKPAPAKVSVNPDYGLKDEVRGLRTDMRKMSKKKSRAVLDRRSADLLRNPQPKHNRR